MMDDMELRHAKVEVLRAGPLLVRSCGSSTKTLKSLYHASQRKVDHFSTNKAKHLCSWAEFSDIVVRGESNVDLHLENIADIR